jgi:hypothetical protein
MDIYLGMFTLVCLKHWHLPWYNCQKSNENRTRGGICSAVVQSSRACTSERESFVVAWIVFIYMKMFVCFIKQACLLAARAFSSFVVYANAHSRINSLHHFSSYENVCLSYTTTSSLACNFSKFGGGAGFMIAFYVWLSFAQQKQCSVFVLRRKLKVGRRKVIVYRN